MRVIAFGLLISLVAAEAGAQQLVDHTRARRFIGDEVAVEGPVARVAPGRGGSLWISLGRPYPSATVVIVVPAEFVDNLDDPRSLEGATIRATGRVYSGEAAETGISRGSSTPQLEGGNPRRPFIVLRDASRLVVVSRPGAARDTVAVIRPR